MIVISLPEDAVFWYQIGWIQFAVRLCRKTKKAVQSTSSTIGGCRQSKGLRISCHQVQFLAVPCTIWVTLGKLLTISEWKFLTWKVKLIISKCWLIVRIVDNAHVAQNVLNKPRCEHFWYWTDQFKAHNLSFLFSLLVKILWFYSLRADRTITCFTTHSRLYTLTILSHFWQLRSVAFCFGKLGGFWLRLHHSSHLSISRRY